MSGALQIVPKPRGNGVMPQLLNRSLIFSLLLLTLNGCFGDPQPRPKKGSTAMSAGGRESGQDLVWKRTDSELALARIYEAVFDFETKKNEWWPIELLPSLKEHSPRLDFMNIGDFPVLKTKNRTKMLIAFEPVSKEVKKMGPKMVRVTYFAKIITVQRTE
jgi:hypothetical protein